MADRLPPLNPLRAFEATARLRSASAAARELNVTHSAISHQLRTLEQSLQVTLFERRGRRLVPTPQAALLLPVVSNAFTDIATATAAMKRPATSGTLRLTCVPALLSLWLIPRLHEFSELYPDVNLSLTALNDPMALHSPDVDLSILYGNGAWRDCWARLWSRIELFPVASPTLLNKRPLRTIRDLRDHVLLHADGGAEWNTWLTAAAGNPPLGRQHMMGDARLAIEAAMHGQGVALGDTITSGRMIARGELVAPFELGVPANDAFYIACRHEMHAMPIARAFIDWMYSVLR